MHYLPTGGRGRPIDARVARGVTRARVHRTAADVAAKARTDAVVAAERARLGLAPVKPVKRKRAVRRLDAEHRHGTCKSLTAAECAELGLHKPIDPVAESAPTEPRRGTRSVFDWREAQGRRLATDW